MAALGHPNLAVSLGQSVASVSLSLDVIGILMGVIVQCDFGHCFWLLNLVLQPLQQLDEPLSSTQFPLKLHDMLGFELAFTSVQNSDTRES